MARPRTISDEEILIAARRIFLEKGPAVTTGEIARDLGVSQATLFKRFSTKEELFLSAMAPPEKPEWLDFVSESPVGESLAEELEELVGVIIASTSEMFPRIIALKAAGIGPEIIHRRFKKPAPLVVREALSAWFTRAEERYGARVVDPDLAADLLFGSIHSMFFINFILGEKKLLIDEKKTAKSIVDILYNGIAPGAKK